MQEVKVLSSTTINPQIIPTEIFSPRISIAERVVSVSTSLCHTLLVTTFGSVYSYGDNADGQLGNGTYSRCDQFQLVDRFLQGNIVISKVQDLHVSFFLFSLAKLTWPLSYLNLFRFLPVLMGKGASLPLSATTESYICGEQGISVESPRKSCPTPPGRR